MITSHRRRHRWLAPCFLGSALLVLVAGLAARPRAFAERFGGPEAQALPLPESFEALGPLGDSPLILGWKQTGGGPDGTLWVSSSANLTVPGPLLYECVGPPGTNEPLPGDAKLLGPLTPATPLLVERPTRPDYLVIYSLGHQEVFSVTDLKQEAVE